MFPAVQVQLVRERLSSADDLQPLQPAFVAPLLVSVRESRVSVQEPADFPADRG
jgi:hypothetical protein